MLSHKTLLHFRRVYLIKMLRKSSVRLAKGLLSKSNNQKLCFSTVARAGGSWDYRYLAAAGVVAVATIATSNSSCESDINGVSYEKGNVLTNWSETHSCSPARIYEPKSAQEVCRVLENHHSTRTKIRAVGTALSPNGLGMTNNDAISVHSIDYVEVDKQRKLVTVGAGARVADVLKELNKYDLTLENFSSIQEQQMGGWTQVAAHGTGCTLPTVEEMIVRMKLATPTEGLLTLSDTSNPRLFRMAKTGLGALGVVTELTLRCVPRHKLLEYTFTLPTSSILKQHYERLDHFRHVRYMWFPYTSKVCLVVSNPTGDKTKGDQEQTDPAVLVKRDKELLSGASLSNKTSLLKPPTEAMCELLLRLCPHMDRKTVFTMSFSQLRDHLLAVNPLDVGLVKQINTAEADFWERSAGFKVDDSINILGFDCGGAQWVLEVCFPIGRLEDMSGKDITFVQKLLKLIEHAQLPAPCPIEQRWTARSTSPMSPAYSSNPDDVFSWVGVIMYLPAGQNDTEKAKITAKFHEYVELLQPLLQEYNASIHWAKLEVPVTPEDTSMISRTSYKEKIENLQNNLNKKYPVKEFNQYRDALDPHRILSNNWIETCFGK